MQEGFSLNPPYYKKTVFYCLLLGFSCTFGFLLTGKWIGQFIFQNTLAGSFILILSWICPFLYLSTTLTSVLHGLGKPGRAFYINMSGCTLRIFFIYALIPTYGIRCYLYGMLAGELLTTFYPFLRSFGLPERNCQKTACFSLLILRILPC